MQLKAASSSEVVSFFGAKRSGEGYVAKCPAHEDSNASLSLREKNGRWAVKCFAGCEFDRIVSLCPEEIRSAIRGSRPEIAVGRASRREVCAYRYVDEKGELLYECVRFDPKAFRPRRPYEKDPKEMWKLGGVRRVLYHLRDVNRAIKGGQKICLCEGEKDVDSLRALGQYATTNISGAASFTRDLAEQLRGASVTIFEDQDDAGKERTEKLVRLLRGVAKEIHVARDPALLEHKDVSDYIASLPPGSELRASRIADILATAKPIDEIPELVTAKEKPEGASGKKEATPEDYINFVMNLPLVGGELRRDLITDKLCAKAEDGTWVPWDDDLRAYIRAESSRFGKFFNRPLFDDVLEGYRLTLPKRIVIDLPTWDGRDRIGEITSHFELKNVSQKTFDELIRQWGAGVWHKVYDHEFQNVCPIIQGAQGCGKDSFVAAICRGWGQYFGRLHVNQRKPEDTALQTNNRVVLNISEFERTSKFEVATLRELLTAPETDVRASFGRNSKKRPTRASFISSANAADVLADGHGNRRYWLFELAYAGFKNGQPEVIYPGLWADPAKKENGAQIVAQFRALHDSGFIASKEARLEMQEFMGHATPEDFEEMVLDAYIREARLLVGPSDIRGKDGDWLYKFTDIEKAVEAAGQKYNRSTIAVLKIIGAKGMRVSGTGNVKLYRIRRPASRFE